MVPGFRIPSVVGDREGHGGDVQPFSNDMFRSSCLPSVVRGWEGGDERNAAS